MTNMTRLKGTIARVLVGAFVLQVGTGTGYAAPTAIPTGSVDFSVLAAVSAALNSAPVLEKWRTGTPNQAFRAAREAGAASAS